MESNVKQDCYAYMDKNGGCWALNRLYCLTENCRFYCPKNQVSKKKLEQAMKTYELKARKEAN